MLSFQQARHTATATAVFRLGSPVAVACALEAHVSGQTATGNPVYSVTAGDVAALCRVPIKRVIGTCLLLSMDTASVAVAPVAVEVTPARDRNETPSATPAPDQAAPVAASMGHGEFDASEALEVVMNYLNVALPPAGGRVRANRGGDGSQSATAAAPAPPGLSFAMIDVDTAAKVIAAEYHEAAQNEQSSRIAADLVRAVPGLVRHIGAAVRSVGAGQTRAATEGMHGLLGAALQLSDWLQAREGQ